MANREIGEVKLVAKGETYTLRFGSYAIAQMESELGKPMLAIALELEDENKRGMRTLLAALWAALQEHHPETDMRGAGKILDQAGYVPAGQAIAECLNLAFPETEGKPRPLPNRKQRRAKKATAK